MKLSPLKTNVTEVIGYSRLIAQKLNSGECIALHQWAQQNKELAPKLQLKFKQLLTEIKAKRWELPRIKYDDNLYQYYYCTETLKWIKTINNK